MGRSFFDLEQNIRLKVEASDEVALQATRVNQITERYVLQTLRLVLEKCGRADLIDMAYTIIKELAINGVKANQKRLFFEEVGLDIRSPDDYAQGLHRFRNEFSEAMNERFGRLAVERGVYVLVLINYDDSGMCVEVVNNTPILPFEEQRLREKMRKGMGYNDIAEFYMDNMDNTEGAGLGIALIIILLKGANIDPALFRIFTLPDRTVARLELPFNDAYVSKRQRLAEAGG
ncbi:MAG: histidine kinase [Leptospirales bacterium]|nr:histidine kinase [Leptospirales bacterium]